MAVAEHTFESAVTTRRLQSVQVLAALGLVLFGAELFYIVKWVTGPNFTPVPFGPDIPPEWMQIAIRLGEATSSLLAIGLLYHYVFIPWRRDRKVSFEGLMFLSLIVLSPFDIISDYFQNWFTYNAFFINYGTVLTELPGVLSRNVGGANVVMPIIFLPAAYVSIGGEAILVSGWLRKIKARWPRLNDAHIVGIAFLIGLVGILIFEGFIMVPLGYLQFGGGLDPLWGVDHYYRYPAQEVLHGALIWATFPLVLYFVNDKGQRLAERGVDQLEEGIRKSATRFLACLFITHMAMVVVFHLPHTLWATNAIELPMDTQTRSYFTNHTCGPVVDRMCPGPSVPLFRPGSPYLNYKGQWVTP